MKFGVGHIVKTFFVCEFLIGCVCKFITFEEFQDPEGPWKRQPIVIQNGGYQNLLIAIHGENEESVDLIENVKNAFTGASKILFEATKHRVYFQDISILLPSHWSKNRSYKSPRPNETYHTSRVLVRDEQGDAAPPSVPFVRQPGGCGQEGEYMYLPRRLLISTDNSVFGNPAKVIAHLWGHLRWGLFDEFPATPDDQFFFRSSMDRVEPSFCPTDYTGKVFQGDQEVKDLSLCTSGQSNHSCEFVLTNKEDLQQRVSKGKGSLMSYYLSDSVTRFCHSDPEGDVHSRHNHEAPTQQNRICLGKSSWDVIMESGDILKPHTPRLNAVAPRFHFLQNTDDLNVVVLDARANMLEGNKFKRMIEAYTHYVYDLFPPYSLLGVVSVNTTAEKVFPCLKLWEKDSFRWQMTKGLPSNPVNHSSLGASIPKAIEVLREQREDISGSTIFIMSDGTDVITPTIAEVQSDVANAGVIIASLPFSTSPSENIVLSNTVNSKYTKFLQNIESKRRYQGTTVTDQNRFIRIANTDVYLDSDDQYDFHVNVDDAFNENQELFVRLYWNESKPDILVVMEDGTNVMQGRIFNDSSGQSLNFYELALPVDSQKIHVYLNRTVAYSQEVNVEVFTGVFLATDVDLVGVRPVRACAMMFSSYVNVTKERMIRLYGTVSQEERPIVASIVKADVTNPEGGKTTLLFRDDGNGIDNHNDDGIYSAYFTKFTSSGVYHVQMFAGIRKRGQKRKDDYFTSGAVTTKRDYPIRYLYGDLQPFQRALLPISFTASDVPKDYQTSDYLPPGTITDLRFVTMILTRNIILKLTWTAPGNDVMEGRAQGYDLRFTSTRTAMSDNFPQAKKVTEDSRIFAAIENPRHSEETELLNVSLSSYFDNRIYFAIKAFDENENFGDISNILEIELPNVNASSSTPYLPETQTTGFTNVPEDNNLSKAVLYLIAFICILAVTVVLFLILLYVIKNIKSKQKVSSSHLEKNA